MKGTAKKVIIIGAVAVVAFIVYKKFIKKQPLLGAYGTQSMPYMQY